MNLQTILLIAQVFVSLLLIGLVLIQKGKGADAGAGFGAGASGTVFGAKGSSNFFSRLTAILATVFILNSLALANLAGTRTAPDSIMVPEVSAPDIELPSSDLPMMDALEPEPSTTLEGEMPQVPAPVTDVVEEPEVDPPTEE